MPEKKRSLRVKALKIVAVQAILVGILTISLGSWRGYKEGYSLLLGGLTSILPNLLFTYRLFSETGASAAHRIIKRFYRGEVIKLALMGLLFIIIVRTLDVILIPYVAGFSIAQVGILLAPILLMMQSGEH